jgi:hypothetical protein
MQKSAIKRTVDMQIMADWVETGARVLDLGCGRGVLMEFLAQSKKADVIGVDLDVDKITSCIKRGVSAYRGDMMGSCGPFPTIILTGLSARAPSRSWAPPMGSSPRRCASAGP